LVRADLDKKKVIISGVNALLFQFKSQFRIIEKQISQSIESIREDFIYKIDFFRQNLVGSIKFLNSVSPRNIMSMGYSVVKDSGQKIVRSSDQLEIDSTLSAYFYKGSVEAKVIKSEA
jgi:exonuclease VII large subunit